MVRLTEKRGGSENMIKSMSVCTAVNAQVVGPKFSLVKHNIGCDGWSGECLLQVKCQHVYHICSR